eukprot:GCRY01001016.1.p1 GENE.GCRY01001016.1~~GCRY01001016.1.p1  ORF type:complete len:290 (-),score=34.91 GCRY01001016.1:219-1088(-)
MSIFVSGASGTVGGATLKSLASHSASVVAGVRDLKQVAKVKIDPKAKVKFLECDFSKEDTLVKAFLGIKVLFLLLPFSPDMVHLCKNAIQAAKTARVEHIVKLSNQHASLSSPASILVQHAQCDQLIENSGIDFTIIKPAFFSSNILSQASSIKEYGKFIGASGMGKIAYIDVGDIAATVAAVCLHPAKFSGKTLCISGPEALSEQDIAEYLSALLKKTVIYENLTPEKLYETYSKMGFPVWVAENLVEFERIKARGDAALITTDVVSTTGFPAKPIENFLQENHRAFI